MERGHRAHRAPAPTVLTASLTGGMGPTDSGDDGVAQAALARYDVGRHRLVRLAESFNTVFRVESAGRALVLRVGPAHRVHAVDAVRAEAGWTRELAAQGLTVPQLVSAADGAPSVAIGGRVCSLWTWVSGQPVARPASGRDVAQLAGLAARLHGASPPAAERPAGALDRRSWTWFDLPDALDELPRALRGVLVAARDRGQDAIDSLWHDAGAPRLVHGDLTPSNVVRDGDALFAIDFQDLGWAHVQQDLAHTIFGLTRGRDLAAGLAAVRSAYERARPWPDLDLARLTGLAAARRVSMVNLAVHRGRPDLVDYAVRHAAELNSAST